MAKAMLFYGGACKIAEEPEPIRRKPKAGLKASFVASLRMAKPVLFYGGACTVAHARLRKEQSRFDARLSKSHAL